MSERFRDIYGSLEPISEQEVEMLFPGAISSGADWIWTEPSVRIFGVSYESVLHMFVRPGDEDAFVRRDHSDGIERELDEYNNWVHYIWEGQKWEWIA